MVQLEYYLYLAAIMFSLGALGLVIRRNVIVVLMCVELMLNAVNIVFVVFSRHHGNLDGQVAVFFVMVIAAAEACVGLAIVISLFRAMRTVESDDAADLKW